MPLHLLQQSGHPEQVNGGPLRVPCPQLKFCISFRNCVILVAVAVAVAVTVAVTLTVIATVTVTVTVTLTDALQDITARSYLSFRVIASCAGRTGGRE